MITLNAETLLTEYELSATLHFWDSLHDKLLDGRTDGRMEKMQCIMHREDRIKTATKNKTQQLRKMRSRDHNSVSCAGSTKIEQNYRKHQQKNETWSLIERANIT